MLKITKTTDRKIYNSLVRWLDYATDEQVNSGMSWYGEAQTFTQSLAKKYDICPYIVAGVVSALSPNNKWPRNKIDAEAIISAYTGGDDAYGVKVCTYNANKRRAIKILAGETTICSKSPKTNAFANNVGLLSDSHVTVDKWHIRACLVSPSHGKRKTIESVTPKHYHRIESITAKIARERNLKAYQVQAIIWVTIRNAWGF